MRVKKSVLAAVICAMSLCLALVGCGGGNAESEDPNSETVLMTNTESLNVAVCDDEICSITIVEAVQDHQGDSGYLVDCTNKTDKAIYVCASADSYVSGNAMYMDGGESVQPGETMEDIYLFFYGDDLGGGIETLVDVEFAIDVWEDVESPTEPIASYDVAL